MLRIGLLFATLAAKFDCVARKTPSRPAALARAPWASSLYQHEAALEDLTQLSCCVPARTVACTRVVAVEFKVNALSRCNLGCRLECGDRHLVSFGQHEALLIDAVELPVQLLNLPRVSTASTATRVARGGSSMPRTPP